MAFANVKLLDDKGVELSTAVTDFDGNYWFEDVAPGKYTLVPEEATTNAEFKQSFKPES